MKHFTQHRLALAGAAMASSLAGLPAQAASPVPELPATAAAYAPLAAAQALPFGGELLAGGLLLISGLCLAVLVLLLLRDRRAADAVDQPAVQRRRRPLMPSSRAPRRTRRPLTVASPRARS